MCESKQRQAGTLSQDIEITPQMIEAGIDAYWALDVEEIGSKELVKAIYTAMANCG